MFERTGIPPGDVGTVIAGSMAQASFDAYVLPRHIGLYAGVPIEVPAHLVQRVCGTGLEVIDAGRRRRLARPRRLALCVGTESMSRNPDRGLYPSQRLPAWARSSSRISSGRRCSIPAANANMGDTAENLARQYRITRAGSRCATPRAASSARWPRRSRLPRRRDRAGEDRDVRGRRAQAPRHQAAAASRATSTATAIRPSPLEALAKIRPAFGGVQTGGNSLRHRRRRRSGAGGIVRPTPSGTGRSRSRASSPARRSACRRDIMGIGPVPAIRALLAAAGLTLDRDRPHRDQRGFRRAGARLRRASSASTRTSSTSTAAPSRSATRSARPACVSR